MSQKSVPDASVKLTSFSCPVCGAHSSQTWFTVSLEQIKGEPPVPFIPTDHNIATTEEHKTKARDDNSKEILDSIIEEYRKTQRGEPFLSIYTGEAYKPPKLGNVFISFCYTCKKPSIWLHDRLLYPSTLTAPPPSQDMPDEVMSDFLEARNILDQSPRGAAALLRLAIEKICNVIGAEGSSIDKKIGNLVSKGLPDTVQRALDAVRVIGNEAVHPGTIDLQDDRDTATKLFHLVNFIVEDRISRPKQIDELYGMIPEAKRNAIEARDKT